MVARVHITEAAAQVVEHLRATHGELIFHQSGGCCDGSSPMCFPKGELMIDDNDVWLGQVHGCNFYMSKDQFAYWQHTKLTINVVKGRGASFSLEIPLGLRFVTESSLFTDAETNHLAPIRTGE